MGTEAWGREAGEEAQRLREPVVLADTVGRFLSTHMTNTGSSGLRGPSTLL